MTRSRRKFGFRSRIVRRFLLTIRHYLIQLYHRADEHHIFLMCGGLAFSLFACVIPLMLILFSVLGIMFQKTSIESEINTFIERAIPYQVYADFIREVIVKRVEEFKLYKNIAGVLGVGGLLIAATSLFSSMRTVLDKAFRIPEPEPMLMGKARDLGLLAIVIAYFLLSTTILPAWEVISKFANRVAVLQAVRFQVVEDIILGAAAFILIWTAFYIIYFLVPYVRQPRRVIMISSLSAAIMWEVAKQIFGFYITNFATLKMIYGAYALAVVSAFWIYYTAIVFILGAEIGQISAERQKTMPRSLPEK